MTNQPPFALTQGIRPLSLNTDAFLACIPKTRPAEKTLLIMVRRLAINAASLAALQKNLGQFGKPEPAL